MSPEDARLVAALTLLAGSLAPIIDEIAAGEFDEAERHEFATVLATIAADLDPGIVLPAEALRGESATATRRARSGQAAIPAAGR